MWEAGEDMDSLMEVLGRMRLPKDQQNRLIRKLAFNLQPGVLAPHLQEIYRQLVWLDLSAEEFQEAVEAYEIPEEEKDELMDTFLWEQLARTL